VTNLLRHLGSARINLFCLCFCLIRFATIDGCLHPPTEALALAITKGSSTTNHSFTTEVVSAPSSTAQKGCDAGKS
jgi:hypothetical protein